MNTLTIPQSQIISKKKVGESSEGPLTYVKTVGGLHMIVNKKGTVVATGPHRAVARHIASTNIPDIVWTELSKADHVPLESFSHLLAEYEALTNELRKMQGVE